MRLMGAFRKELPAAERDVDLPQAKATAQMLADSLSLTTSKLPASVTTEDGLVLKAVRSPFSLKGGHNPIQAMADQHGRLWVYKSELVAKDAYRTLGEKAGADLARAVGLPTPELRYVTQRLNGRLVSGTLVPMVDHAGKGLPAGAAQLTAKQKDQLLASHVFRWLIGDHDGKVANFLRLKNGDVVTIDFGNMYRHLTDDVLDRNYRPNPIKPLYNKLWDGYVSGEVSLDFRAGMEQIARVEALPDGEFQRIMQPYVDARYAQPGARPEGLETKEQFMAAALRRKQNLRRDMMRFYDGLIRERQIDPSRAIGR